MSIGTSIGMNFINKGIDQFSYGVGQEYNRYAREKSRKWQVLDQQTAYSNEFKQKMDMAKQYGIHPLALVGTGYTPGPVVSTPSISPPSGGGVPISGNRDSEPQKKLIEAQTRLINAQADQIGQSPTVKNIPSEITAHGENTGITAGVNPQMKYEKTPEGFFQLLPRDNEAYSDEAPMTTQALFLYDDVARRKFGHTIKHNWSDPKLQYKKELWLKSRPPADHKGLIVLWNEKRGQWQQVPKTKENAGHIWLNTKVYNPRGRKQRPSNYDNLPLS